jgi:Ca2+/Na+ antiporter
MPSDAPSRELALLGSFLPLLAVVATVAAALLTRRTTRWTLLITLPASFLVLCWVSASSVLYDGNLLGAVLFAAYYLGLLVYYPALFATGLIALHVTRRLRTAMPPPRPGTPELKSSRRAAPRR